MEGIKLKEIEESIKPKDRNNIKNELFKSVKINSKEIEKGDIFVALVGKNHDAHAFIPEAIQNGAYLSIVEKPVEYPYLLVDNTYDALKKLAKLVYEKSQAKSIAVLGSSGKTTTKELICSILSQKEQCCKTKGNENNFIGISKTLLSIKDEKVCVVEVGTNHQGEISDIKTFFEPDIAVFTNIGKSHIGNFGSMDAILSEKTSIISFDTLVIYNYDDLWLRKAFNKRNAVKCSAINPLADVYVNKVTDNGVELSVFGKIIKLNLNNDKINIYNILISIAASITYNDKITQDDINRAMLEFEQPKFRMQTEIVDNTEFILDCYNANPDSVKYALNLLNNKKGKKLAILGDMLELGEFSFSLHKEIGDFIKELGVDLIAYGNDAYYIYESAKSNVKAYFFRDKQDIVNKLKSIHKDYDTILIKGSRGMKMEEIFFLLKDEV